MTDEELAILEKLLKDLTDAYLRFDEFRKKLMLLNKVYPTITNPVSGGPTIPHNQVRRVTVTSNYSFTSQAHEVRIENAAGVVQPGTRVAVFAGGAEIPLQVYPLLPNTDYVLICDAGPTASLPFVPHCVAIHTAPLEGVE